MVLLDMSGLGEADMRNKTRPSLRARHDTLSAVLTKSSRSFFEDVGPAAGSHSPHRAKGFSARPFRKPGHAGLPLATSSPVTTASMRSRISCSNKGNVGDTESLSVDRLVNICGPPVLLCLLLQQRISTCHARSATPRFIDLNAEIHAPRSGMKRSGVLDLST